jgi:phage tail-like protein
MPAYGVRSSSEEDGLIAAWFSVEFQGAIAGVFRECSALGSQHDVVTYNGTSEKGMQVTNKMTGNLKFNPITLKRGLTDNQDFWEWHKTAAIDGDVASARKSGTITMYSPKREAVAKWEFHNAWPSKVTGPTFDASSNNVAIEELTIVYEDYRRTQ